MIGLRELTKMRAVVDLEKRGGLLFEDCLKSSRGVERVVEVLGGVEEPALVWRVVAELACIFPFV